MKSQLLFLYIHQYRNINQQGFNFSSAFDIRFDVKYQNGHYTDAKLSMVLSNDNIPGLFHTCFTDVKGIIGENGAGKSTLLQYLAFQAHEHPEHVEYNDAKEYRDIAVYSIKNSDGSVDIKVAAGHNWGKNDLNIKSLKDYGRANRHFVGNIFWEELPGFQQDVIYYSNVADLKWEYAYNELKNISTNYHLRHDQESFRLDHQKSSRDHVSEITAHILQEEARRMRFALLFEHKLPFKLSNRINVFFSNDFRNEVDQFTTNVDEDTPQSAMPILAARWITVSDPEKKPGGRLRNYFYRHYFDYFIYSHLLHGNDTIDNYFKEYPSYRAATLQKINDLWENGMTPLSLANLLQFLTVEEKKINLAHGVGLGNAELSRAIKHLIWLDKLLDAAFERNEWVGNGFSLPLDSHTIDIHEQYKRTIYIKEFMHFTFPGLSSGELGFLTLFSRFYSLVDHMGFSPNRLTKKQLLILIDEGDLYFHPKWQVQFLDFINQIFPLIFHDNYEIQLVLTSHSPFIASDLPKNNLLFLKKGGNEDLLPITREPALGKCFVETGPDYTFGANVHELLSDSFFLKGAHIGQIAKNTIYSLLDFLENVPLAKGYDTQQLPNIIRQIGEPWVRSRLEEKFEAFNTSSEQ